MQLDNILESKVFRIIILSVVGVIVLSCVFSMGVFVGARKAEFSFKWAEQYHNNFAGPRQGFFGNMMDSKNQFANSNGVFGQILKINDNTITVKDNDGDKSEKTILIDEKTILMCQKRNLKLSELKVDDNIIVIGSPNNSGQIHAELIRVMPIQK